MQGLGWKSSVQRQRVGHGLVASVADLSHILTNIIMHVTAVPLALHGSTLCPMHPM